MRRFTPDFFAANAGFGLVDETPLLIVGLPRSGTTLVEQILSRHPEIGAGGEQPFWIRQALAPSVREATDADDRSGPRTGAAVSVIAAESGAVRCPGNRQIAVNVLCLGLIHLLLPKARIIQCRRHPVDTCLSIYFTHFRQTVAFTNDKASLAAAYRQYARLMDHWRAVLPAESLFEVEYEKLVGDREKVTRELVAFTGLRVGRRMPRAGTQRTAGHHREPVAGAPTGVFEFGGALAQLRALARRTPIAADTTRHRRSRPAKNSLRCAVRAELEARYPFNLLAINRKSS